MMSRSPIRSGRTKPTVIRGYQLVESYVEPGASATNDRRPEIQRMIEAGTSKPAANGPDLRHDGAWSASGLRAAIAAITSEHLPSESRSQIVRSASLAQRTTCFGR
jgi:hypothetical protein